MKRRQSYTSVLLIVLTLVLAFVTCPAEGFTLFEQHEAPVTPWPQLRPGIGQIVLDLSGRWEVAPSENDEYSAGWIPGCFAAQDEAVIFRRRFTLADTLRQYHFQLVIPEMHYRIEVKVNGSFVSSFTGSHLGFSSDIARNHLIFGAPNEIVLKIESRLSARNTLPVMPQLLHPARYGGIFSGIYLRGVPDWSIEEASLNLEGGTLDSSGVRAAVQVRIAQYDVLPGAAAGENDDREVRVLCAVRDSAGKRLAEARSEKIERGNSGSFQITVNLPRFPASLWSPGRPALYDLHTYLVAGADTVHEFSRPVGFKQACFENGRLTLNGRSIRIRGTDYVPESERGRRAIAYSQLKADLTRIKSLGMNAIRVPFGPPPPILMSLADEIGLLVFVDTGLDWIPPSVLSRIEYRQLILHSIERLIATTGDHVALLAYGLGSHLAWDDPRTLDVLQECRLLIFRQHVRTTYVEAFDPGRVGAVADFILASRHPLTGARLRLVQPAASAPVIESRVGHLAMSGTALTSDASMAIVEQADYLVRQILISDADSSSQGFLLHAFSDYYGHAPLTIQPRRIDPALYTFGLVGIDRQERIAFFKLRDLAQTGQVSPPVPGEQRKSPPMVFPIVGLTATLLVSLEMRRNNVFRQNLRRVFLHAHGFYCDLRYRRFLHTAQPLMLWMLESVTLGLLISSILYSYRESFHFDYILTHVIPWPHLKADLIGVIWQPLQLTALMTVVMLIGLAAKMLIVRLLSLFFKERVDLWQAANYVVWSYAGLLFLLPVATVLYRVLQMAPFASVALTLVCVVLLWCVARLLTALRTGFGTTSARIYALSLVVVAAVIGGLLLTADSDLGAFVYLPFFSHVFSVL